MLESKRILLIVAGGIAAYKSLELIRRLRDQGARVRCVLTRAGAEFVTPLSLGALSGEKVHQDMFSLTDEVEMGHIQLSRDADLVVVAPATADIIACLANGRAEDLATTLMLATDKPILLAPAMNVRMWEHPATRRNLAQAKADGALVVGPNEGDMACGEYGLGRMAEPDEILAAIAGYFQTGAGTGAKPQPGARTGAGPLTGRRVLVTSGPTFEPIDPARYITNRSSGRQGHAIAAALAGLGAECTLVSGPTALQDPGGLKTVRVETALDMLAACEAALPVDVAVCAAAVADWRVAHVAAQKIKRNGGTPKLALTANPDILQTLARRNENRPRLVVGFAAETENLLENAEAKRRRKGCDWIVANDVGPGTNTFGGAENRVHLLTGGEPEHWPLMDKRAVAAKLADRIAAFLASA
jgi:phosphopantothenoylcysteine decarboxylase / phosphopantothenate---cysteine ligase